MRPWTDGDRGNSDPLSISVDTLATGRLYDSVERKLKNESERTGFKCELHQIHCFEIVTTWLTSAFFSKTLPVYYTKLL